MIKEEFLRIFKNYVKTEQFQKDIQERKNRQNFFHSFTKEKINNLSEVEFKDLIKNLWASEIFVNKDYLTNKLIQENGLENIKKWLNYLLWDQEKISIRYDKFLNRIKGVGPAMVTEILCHVRPDQAGIWNDKARKALAILGFKEKLPLKKYRISAEEYDVFNKAIFKIAHYLKEQGFKEADALFVDYFLWIIYLKKKDKLQQITKEMVTLDHNEVRDKIFDIGAWLGFDVEKEKNIAKGSRIDVSWQARIGNLGVVNYVFEVQGKGGSIDGLILNLQKALNNPSVQKLIVVSDTQQLTKIKNEIADLSGDFQKMISYWDVQDVERAHESLSIASEIINKLELIKGTWDYQKTKINKNEPRTKRERS